MTADQEGQIYARGKTRGARWYPGADDQESQQ
jgi:hypothetical protein